MVHPFPCGRPLGSTNTRYPCPSTNLPTPKGLFRSGWCFEYAFWKWEGRQGVHLSRPSFPSPSGGHLARPSFPSPSGGHLARPSPLHSRGSPNQGGQNQNWLPHPCLLGGPKEGGNAMSPLHSRGSPNKGGAKSELAASSLPSRGPRRGRKCYITPAFSRVPNTKQKWPKSGHIAYRSGGILSKISSFFFAVRS